MSTAFPTTTTPCPPKKEKNAVLNFEKFSDDKGNSIVIFF